MFQFNSNSENKAKLEHKLYLARENPEPVFDLSYCGLKDVPSGVFSLCRVFLKETLRLEHNNLTSLKGGGNLQDLRRLKYVDLSYNKFSKIPHEIGELVNLLELHLNDNNIRELPHSLCNLNNLRVLNISNNKLNKLPDNFGCLIQLQSLNMKGNRLSCLPKSICNLQQLHSLECDRDGFTYPPRDVMEKGLVFIIQFICEDVGYPFNPNHRESLTYNQDDQCQEKRAQDFLKIESERLRENDLLMATTSKSHKKKLLSDIKEQQNELDTKLARIQKEKDLERQKLLENLRSAEETTCLAVNQLLALKNMSSLDLAEYEENENARLLALVNRRCELISRSKVLADMESILEQESVKFKRMCEIRTEMIEGVLCQDTYIDSYLSDYLAHQNLRRYELVTRLQNDEQLQRAAVGALLERSDARSWGLIQQVKLIESQLAALTVLEMDRRRLEMTEQLIDLAEQRSNLSALLMQLLDQQNVRRAQLLTTLKYLDNRKENTGDFWLKQYQSLLERLPSGLSEKQNHMDFELTKALLDAQVIHCLPILAKFRDFKAITESDLLSSGITLWEDRLRILEVIRNRERGVLASAPPDEEDVTASAPAFNECVVCIDRESRVIFIPCGHLCCCNQCCTILEVCPMCRTGIQQKINIIYC